MGDPQNSESTSNAFGHSGRYYADRQAALYARQRPFTDLERRFAGFLHSHVPNLKATVERAFKQWNNILRDYLRTETGLRLTVGEDARAVPVHVVDGLPSPMADILGRLDPKIWSLVLNRAVLASAGQGMDFLQTEFNWITELKDIAPSPATLTDVFNTATLLGQLLDLIQKQSAVKQIREIQQDILGAYFFHVPEVHLYWMVIGFMAGFLGVSIEALAAVVVTHELAHAYTHLGRDIDGGRWETHAFAGADLSLVEGLAQFYTAVICQKLEPRFPAAQHAYGALLACQSGPYLVHKKWMEDADSAGQAVRVSMLRCRSNAIGKLERFSAFFQECLDQFKRGKKTPARSSVAP
jgi:hypothetical protein